eukprot:CAMPEP_0197034806 /NCGR_PEP_ID=MMETSP1384-20130603/12774_1 /TAXON_ID=29189 /ORGANISM="Ammonia sp." /LENGTH=333 /DNA_ID=CAMNT_0042464765 /DNA_START=51 /DNA_END=1052 /DNA_ORIENTATION=-
MSFLFGWTKLFRSNTTEKQTNESFEEDASEVKDDLTDSHNHSDNLEDINADNHGNDKQLSQSEENEWSDEEEEEEEKEDELLGGEFETLEEEIKYLREQNNKLKEKYKYHKSQHKLLKSNFHKTGVVQMKINGKLINVQQTDLNMSLDELSEKVEQRLPKFLQRARQNRDSSDADDTIFLPSDASNQHGVIDIKTVEWGDLVKYNTINTDDALATFMNHDEKLQLEETQGLNGPFIVLREEDIIDAIACFVAQCVMNIPECRNLDHEEMMSMITGTFSELKGKGPLGKMMDWGSFVYSTYGWTATAYTVYSNAALAKTVLSCLVSAAWIIGVL